MSALTALIPELGPVAEAFVNMARAHGLNPVITSVRRSAAAQRRLYDLRQRTLAGTLRPGEAPQRYPVAYPGTSDHERGWAFDMVCDNPAEAGAVWNSWGGHWNPSDAVHFYVR
jgi:LAS superfamily LD-carboxypeptidase LdcB